MRPLTQPTSGGARRLAGPHLGAHRGIPGERPKPRLNVLAADRWSDDARSCLATISSDDEADGCITRLLDRDQQRRLAADRARLAADRVDAHE